MFTCSYEMSRKTHLFPLYLNEDVGRYQSKKDKIISPRNVRDNSSTRSTMEREKTSTMYKRPKTGRARSASSGQQTVRPLHAQRSDTSVKVKSNTMRKKESWSQLLRGSKEHSTFNKFDPLRTLHFLIKELECRIKNDIPGEFRYLM